MNDEEIKRKSKYLSKHLRHDPARIGLTLAPGGWVEVADLLAACARQRFPISQAELEEVVARNDKRRFSFDESESRIRANQGHSVDVDLQLAPTAPPDVLYHGTGHGAVAAIREHGLQRMTRQHVHLSPDTATAIKVGARHGRPHVFTIDARAMHAAGHVFCVSDNGVWLVDAVPAAFLRDADAT